MSQFYRIPINFNQIHVSFVLLGDDEDKQNHTLSAGKQPNHVLHNVKKIFILTHNNT